MLCHLHIDNYIELNEIELEEPSDLSTSQSTDQSITIKECIGSKETKHQSSLTHHLKEAYEEQPISDAESSNIKTEKEEQDILRLDDDDSEAKSRKQDENSSNQGLKDMRSSDLFGMLVSRRIRK